MKQITMDATIDNMSIMTEFVETQMQKYGCSMKNQTLINAAMDELLSNIIHYAYAPKIGPVTIQVDKAEYSKAISITFIDQGMPYNPLDKEDPDISLSLEDRAIGGLGIYLVKKSMDTINYQFKDGKNILTITKDMG